MDLSISRNPSNQKYSTKSKNRNDSKHVTETEFLFSRTLIDTKRTINTMTSLAEDNQRQRLNDAINKLIFEELLLMERAISGLNIAQKTGNTIY